MGQAPVPMTNPIRGQNRGRIEGKVYMNRKFYDHDFSGMDLTHADFRGATCVNCNFDNSDLSYATFEGANCYRSSFRQSKLYHVNFKDTVLAEAEVDPRDFFAATITLSCDTFDRTKLGKMYSVYWLFLLTLADIDPTLKQKVLGVLGETIGEERVKQLERSFADRTL